MASASQQYVEQYAEAAMEQQRKYGIPASVTLAQGILESSNGKSQLSRECNNHFGIKASQAWIRNGGSYGLYTDDRPNEKFCKYDSVADSYEHHSRVLKNNARYSACFNLESTDYRGWCHGLQRAGYASDRRYASSLISVIEKMDLTKYDAMAVSPSPSLSKQRSTAESTSTSTVQKEISPTSSSNEVSDTSSQSSNYSFPVARKEFMLITSPYGNRPDPLNPSKTPFHKGVDIKANGDKVMATENNGKVVKVNQNANTGGGRSVTVEYCRADGTKYRTTCMHLESVSVKVGDAVNAGDKLGISGNTGTRTTGPHLHFEVKQISNDNTERHIDPSAYLSDIAEKGAIRITALHNGENLLAKYSAPNSIQKSPELNPQMSPDGWMKKLLSSEDSGISASTSDPVMEMAMTMFSSLLALAVQIDGKSKEESMAQATDAALSRQIDITTLVSGAKSCILSLPEGKNPFLSITTSQGSIHHELTNAELSRLSSTINNPELSNEVKQSRISSMIGKLILSEQLSQNYDAQVSRDQTFTLQR